MIFDDSMSHLSRTFHTDFVISKCFNEVNLINETYHCLPDSLHQLFKVALSCLSFYM